MESARHEGRITDQEVLMILTIEIDQEEDGRWIAEVVDIPGALAYGATPEQAQAKAKAIALRVIRGLLPKTSSNAGFTKANAPSHSPS